MPLPGSDREKKLLQEIGGAPVAEPTPEFLQEIAEPTHDFDDVLEEAPKKKKAKKKAKK